MDFFVSLNGFFCRVWSLRDQYATKMERIGRSWTLRCKAHRGIYVFLGVYAISPFGLDCDITRQCSVNDFVALSRGVQNFRHPVYDLL